MDAKDSRYVAMIDSLRVAVIVLSIGILIQVISAFAYDFLPFEELMTYLRSLASGGQISKRMLGSFLSPALLQSPEWMLLAATTFALGAFLHGGGKKVSILLSCVFPLVHGISTLLVGWWYDLPIRIGIPLFVHTLLIPLIAIPIGILAWKIGFTIKAKVNSMSNKKRVSPEYLH